MSSKTYLQILSLAALLGFTACTANESKESNDSTQKETEMKETAPRPTGIKEETVNYSQGSTNMAGFVAYDTSTNNKRPVVMVIHEWWGTGDYTKKRAKQLAELGYLAMAVDLYGNGQTAADPEQAGKLAGPFYENPQMMKSRFDAALSKIKTYAVADTNQVAAIGYCFGGAMAISLAKLGENLSGVVSFHGNLNVVPVKKDLLKAPILVCHGDADPFVKPEEVAAFKKQMDSVGAAYTFKSYPGATHAFTNPDATENGKKFNIPIAYNAAADSASWNDMKDFFGKIFK